MAITMGEAMDKVLHHECPDCAGRLHRADRWLACEQCDRMFRLESRTHHGQTARSMTSAPKRGLA